MQDSLSIKPLVLANVTGSVLGTARSFERAATSVKNRYSRLNTLLGSLNPSRIDIAHTMPAKASDKRQSMIAHHQTRSRTDVSSNVVSIDTSEIRVTLVNTANVTEDEFIADLVALYGAMLESNGAVARAWFRGEY